MAHGRPHLTRRGVCLCECAECLACVTEADGFVRVVCTCSICNQPACGLHAETTTPGGTE